MNIKIRFQSQQQAWQIHLNAITAILKVWFASYIPTDTLVNSTIILYRDEIYPRMARELIKLYQITCTDNYFRYRSINEIGYKDLTAVHRPKILKTFYKAYS